MKFAVQSRALKPISDTYSIIKLSERTGIEKNRLARLFSGTTELTLREAEIFRRHFDLPLFDEPFRTDHLYSADMKKRQAKNSTIDISV